MSSGIKLPSPLFIALDVDRAEEAVDLAQRLSGRVGFKLGPRLVLRYGADVVQAIARHGPVFIDHKFFDIPNTMIASITAAFDAGASFTTVHSWSGKATLVELANLEKKLNQKRPFMLLSVTVLTSFSDDTLPRWTKSSVDEIVDHCVEDSRTAGLHGLVASAWEVARIKKTFAKSFVVTPGVRFADDKSHDQSRVMNPKQALSEGADALVVGRPVVEAKDPVGAAERFLAELR